MSSDLIYALSVECEGLVARVILNGVDVFAEWEGAQRLTQTKVNHFIVEGSNALEVALTPMTDDEGRALGLATLFRLSLHRGVHGVVPGDEGRVARFEWDAGSMPVEPGVITAVWSRQFSVAAAQAFGPWSWSAPSAETVEAGDAPSLIGLVGEVHAAIEARDVDRLVALTTLRDAELCRALGLEPAEFAADQRATWADWFAESPFVLEPFDPAALAAVPQARGRLVRLTDAYGNPPILGQAGARQFAFAMMAAKVNGQWVIAR